MFKKSTSLLLGLLLSCSSSIFAARFAPPVVLAVDAVNDNFTAILNKSDVIIDNVLFNDTNSNSAVLNSSPVSQYGLLELNSLGDFTYTVYINAPAVIDLKAGEIVTDTFEYTSVGASGQSSTAQLIFKIIGNPVDINGDTLFEQSGELGDTFDNVDIEFNDSFTQATPLNSGKNIRGHLHSGEDEDWYQLSSAGNEVITFEVCPQGTVCFGKKSWVLYVFDSDLMTQAIEDQTVRLFRWIDETGSSFDLTGVDILGGGVEGSFREFNHMYLLYREGLFSSALIGIVDPCFDTTNSVDIGVGPGAKNYLIAISSTLAGDAGGTGGTGGVCGGGSVILQEPGLSVSAFRPVNGGGIEPGTYTTTQEFISIFPRSDDQYLINITNTGINPLLSDEALVRSSSFNAETNVLKIPKVRVPTGNGSSQLYEANLKLTTASKSTLVNNLSFFLENISELSLGEVVDAYQATYNPENRQVLIPRVTETGTDKAYSIIMQYYFASAGSSARLEIIDIKLIE